MSKPPPTPPLRMREPLEYQLWEQLQPAFIDRYRSISAGAPSSPRDRRIRPEFLRWFLLEAIPAVEAPIAGFKLRDAVISDTLDLSGCKVGVLLYFLNCEFDHSINLSDANIVGVQFVGGRIKLIRGDRLTASGNLEIRAPRADEVVREPMCFEGQLRLNGAKIRGNLTLRGCRFMSPVPHEPSVFADGLAVDGNVLLDGGFVTPGEIRLNGAKIGRNLDCNGADLKTLTGYTLSAAGAHIAGSVHLCDTQPWSSQTPRRRFTSEGAIRFDGAHIDGDLNCRGGCFAAASTMAPDWRWNPAKESELYSLSVVGAHVAGDVFLSETPPQEDGAARTPFESRGVLRCENARIDGDFNCHGGRFTASAFSATHWQPGRNVNRELYAIEANGMNVAGNICFESAPDSPNEFCITGCASLISANVGRDFSCVAGKFDFSGEEPLTCDGITVGGTTFLDEAKTNGILRFVQATLKQGFYARGMKFDGSETCRGWLREPNISSTELGGQACGIYAHLADVGATFYWQQVELTRGSNPLWLDLQGAKANAIVDDQRSWEALEHFDVTGCQYNEIVNLTGGDTRWRLKELDRSYANLNLTAPSPFQVSCRALVRGLRRKITDYDEPELREGAQNFKPQPYAQLADTLRRTGFDAAASTVLVRLERNRTRYSDFGVLRQLARWALDLFLLYGQSPFRPVLFLLLAAVLSALVFQRTFDSCGFVYAKDMSSPPACPKTAPNVKDPVPQIPAFNALIYAIDTLVPIVDLNQKKSWVLNPSSSVQAQPSHTTGWRDAAKETWHNLPNLFSVSTLIIFNTFFGWVMTTLFAAGVTGLLRAR